MSERKMDCPYCNQPAEYTSNVVVYGKPYGEWPMVWLCRCIPGFAYVGCHNQSDKPLGTMASQQLRHWRIKAHAAIDPIWQEQRMKRNEVYEWLGDRLDRVIHIGESDTPTCRQVIALAEELERKLDSRTTGKQGKL